MAGKLITELRRSVDHYLNCHRQCSNNDKGENSNHCVAYYRAEIGGEIFDNGDHNVVVFVVKISILLKYDIL